MTPPDETKPKKYIDVEADGPYTVHGDIPLVRKIQVVSEQGEPLTWKKQGEIPTAEGYSLCRCGHSESFPFCDSSHNWVDFDGSENAPTNTFAERSFDYPGGSKLIIHFDLDLCTESGFCGNRDRALAEMAAETDDIHVRTEAIHMVEHCPAGALTLRFAGDDSDTEVDLPQQIAVTTEIVAEGAIRGPLWVTGGIQVFRSDGQPLERRNRVTLCNCGHSQIKPLCDGSHRAPSYQRSAASEQPSAKTE